MWPLPNLPRRAQWYVRSRWSVWRRTPSRGRCAGASAFTTTTRHSRIERPSPCLQPTPSLSRKYSSPTAVVQVFTVVRTDEALTAPPVPLFLIHGLVDPSETSCAISLLVRPAAHAAPAAAPALAAPESIPLDALLAGDARAGACLLERLRKHSVARVAAGEALSACLARCLERLPEFFALSEDAKAELRCKVRPAKKLCNQYAGVGKDGGREWLQLRRFLNGGATFEPSGGDEVSVAPANAPQAFHAAFAELRTAAAACVRSLAEALGLDAASWLSLTDLSGEGECAAALSHRGGRACGPTVLRLYRYLPAGHGCGCSAHADMGMITLSAAPRFFPAFDPAGSDGAGIDGGGGNGLRAGAEERVGGGLQLFDPDGLSWYDAEQGLRHGELTLFCGEQLALLSGGALSAPVHRVLPPPGELGTRCSLPFFVRAHPEAILVPRCPPAQQDVDSARRQSSSDRSAAAATAAVALPPPRACEEFVHKTLFNRRPWHDGPKVGADF